jgi:predicted ATPase/class 3 adenylate cyclase/DNA-binding XRE family transcriptional regulator
LDELSSFSEWLKRRRKGAGLTQEQLAQQISCSTSTLRKIEAEERRPSEQIVKQLAEVFNISSEERATFLKFARGQWGAGPAGDIEDTPWRISDYEREPKTSLATFLFTDIEDSTKLWESAPEKMKVALQHHHAILQRAISSNGGNVFQIVGDAFCAAFPTAPAAISAAVTAQRKLYQEQWDLPFPIRVRMGILTGEVERTSNDSPTGGYASNQTLNRVARILQAGHGGQVLLSLVTKELLKDSLPANAELRDLGEHHLKNLIHPEHLFQLNIAGLPSDFPPLNPLDLHRHNLPLQLTSFIGRKKEQNEIINLIAKNRLVTLVGAGGIGKSRLSIQAGFALLNDFPNGTWLVELAPLSDSVLVSQVIITTLGLIEQTNRPPHTILTDFLQAKKSLLILDNCEHLIQACAQLAETLLHACPDLHILATSREALGIAGETVYLVPSLTTPDPRHLTVDTLSTYESVQLFVERAQSALAGFTLTQENASAVAQVCHHLDGIPLALELAAARVKVLRVEEIAVRLNERFHLLIGGTRTALPRQKTLRAMIDWSHDLLSESERVLLRRLSVFAGGWTLEAAESTCGGDGIEKHEILDVLTQLVNKSLILAERKQGQETRYNTLETIRQYAHMKLWAAGEGEMMRQRHLAYFVDRAERAEPNLRTFDMVMWLDWLEIELDNIRVALEWALESDIEAQLRLASALLWFWHIRGHKNEGTDWLERGLSIEAAQRGDQLPRHRRTMIRGKALNASGTLLGELSFDSGKAQPYLEESLTLFQELGPAGKQGMAYALLNLGILAVSQSDFRRWKAYIEQSLTLFREVDDKFGVAECLMSLSSNVLEDDDHKHVRMFAEEDLALRREIGDKDGMPMALANLGILALGQDDYQQALTLYKESLVGLRTVGNKWAIGFILSTYGDIYLWQGDYERATEIYKEAVEFVQDIGDRFLLAGNIYSLGVIAWLEGHYARAAHMFKDSLIVFRELGFYWGTAGCLHMLGDIALAQGNEARAAEWYEAVWTFGQETQLQLALIFALGGLGKVASAQHNYELATKRFEEVLKMSREAGLQPAMIQALYGLGRVAQLLGDYAAAQAFYKEALETNRQRTNNPKYPIRLWRWLKTYRAIAVYPIDALATLAVAQNQIQPLPLRVEGLRRAARLFGVSETLYTPLRFEMSTTERAQHDHSIAAARAALGEEAFAAAWAEGQAMTMEQVIEYVLATENESEDSQPSKSGPGSD